MIDDRELNQISAKLHKRRAVQKLAPRDWRDKALAATKGTKFGSILRCIMRVDRDALPRFDGKCSITCDGFCICDFVDSDGQFQIGAFVGSWRDVINNAEGLARHLSLSPDEKVDMTKLIASWRTPPLQYDDARWGGLPLEDTINETDDDI